MKRAFQILKHKQMINGEFTCQPGGRQQLLPPKK